MQQRSAETGIHIQIIQLQNNENPNALMLLFFNIIKYYIVFEPLLRYT